MGEQPKPVKRSIWQLWSQWPHWYGLHRSGLQMSEPCVQTHTQSQPPCQFPHTTYHCQTLAYVERKHHSATAFFFKCRWGLVGHHPAVNNCGNPLTGSPSTGLFPCMSQVSVIWVSPASQKEEESLPSLQGHGCWLCQESASSSGSRQELTLDKVQEISKAIAKDKHWLRS